VTSARAYTGTLRLVNNSPSTPLLVPLSGTGDPASGVGTQEDLPAEFALSANYPNPFNPSTVIAFAVPRQSFVSITVYNAIGQSVATLVNENRAAGRYTVTFSAAAPGGGQLPSGLYFYRLTAGDFVATRKMMLVK
jgi:hypothetical protein